MIQLKNISKYFDSAPALKDVSLTINQVEIFGLLSPNGAGKSTTINILNTLLFPNKGTVTINGMDLLKESSSCKLLLGVVPQEISLYEELSAIDNLMF